MIKVGLGTITALGIGFLSLTTNLSGRIPETSSNSVDECSNELLMAYFPKVFVNETLSKYKIPEDQWESINKELSEKDKDVLKLVKEKAEKISPDLLKDPQQRQTVVRLFKETLFDVFSQVMRAHGVTDDKQIQEMQKDIEEQKIDRFKKCTSKHREAFIPKDSESKEEGENTDK